MKENSPENTRPAGMLEKRARPHGCLLLAGLLAGCCSVPPAPVEVRVPVTVPCVRDVPARPEFEFGRVAPTASDGEKILALARDWPLARTYEIQLEAVIAGCR